MMIKKLFLCLTSFLLISLLSGCAGMNSQFDCKMKPGVMCANLDQVNSMVDRGQLGSNNSASCPKCNKNIAASGTMTTSNNATPYPIAAPNPGDPIRYGETVMRVWMAPYQDSDGNYYQPTLLYTVIKPGHWLDNPVKAITNDEDPS